MKALVFAVCSCLALAGLAQEDGSVLPEDVVPTEVTQEVPAVELISEASSDQATMSLLTEQLLPVESTLEKRPDVAIVEQLPEEPIPEQFPDDPTTEQLREDPVLSPEDPIPHLLPGELVPERLPEDRTQEELSEESTPEQLLEKRTPEQIPEEIIAEQLPNELIPPQLPEGTTPERLPEHVPEELPEEPAAEQLPEGLTAEKLAEESVREPLPRETTQEQSWEEQTLNKLSTSCPPVGLTKILPFKEGEEVWLDVSEGALCTVWLVSPEHKMKPIARTYNGNVWEAYSGDFSALDITCDDTGLSCSFALPAKPTNDYIYEISSFNHSLSWTDEVARFLEQTTYGPTRDEIANFPESFAEWILSQVSEDLGANSHRQFFRERVNHRLDLPMYSGVATRACDANTRYRKYAFTDKDYSGKHVERYVEIRTDTENGRKVFLVDGQTRTFIEAQSLTLKTLEGVEAEFSDGFWKPCGRNQNSGEVVWVGIGATFQLWHPATGDCEFVLADGDPLGIPEVRFDDKTPPTHPVVNLDNYAKEVDHQYYPGGIAQELFIETNIEDPNCEFVPPVTGLPSVYTVVGIYHGEYYLHDPRFVLNENTVEMPSPDGGSSVAEPTKDPENENHFVLCANAHMNFVNQPGCVLSYEPNTCTPNARAPEKYEAQTIELSVSNFKRIFEATGAGGSNTRYVYAVTGLRQSGDSSSPFSSPCKASTTSRWIKVKDCYAYASVGNTTQQIFSNLISASDDNNPYMRDIFFPTYGVTCDESDVNRVDFAVEVGSQCWLNVHPSYLQVYDFTDWVTEHPGGANSIESFAMPSKEKEAKLTVPVGGDEGFILTFPEGHPMSRFHGWSAQHRIELGRLGDEILLTELPNELLTTAVAKAFNFKATEVLERMGPTVVCGSPHEVANVPTNYGSLHKGAFEYATPYNMSTNGPEFKNQKYQTWMAKAMNASSQLRQRVAWALSQVLVVTAEDVDNEMATESHMAYYDIFVRNAFGNYFDVMKEVSYSPLMATMLSFMESTSTEFTWQKSRRIEYPDENYAREIMQLFSIGLYKMNNDGTPVLDDAGVPVLTYSNDHIQEYARAWTGFKGQEKRGNIEDPKKNGFNRIDPMFIDLKTRDHLPKLGLNGRYIGDGRPLCSDLPYQHFLKKGATYQLLSGPTPRLHNYPSYWGSWETFEQTALQLERKSGLRKRLCNAVEEECQYEVVVVLEDDLACSGVECEISTPRVIEAEPGIYYEYIRTPCVYQAFYNDGQIVKTDGRTSACADSRIETASAGCCSGDKKFKDKHTLFPGERAKYADVELRCAAGNLSVCDSEKKPEKCDDCPQSPAFWSSSSCRPFAKLNLDGTVAIVHIPEEKKMKRIYEAVRQDVKTFFRVMWDGPISDVLADYGQKCANELGGTFAFDDGLCILPVSVEETPVFGERTKPSREQILSELHIGAFEPGVLDDKHVVTFIDGGVKMYSNDGLYSSESVFEVIDDNGITRYLKNLRSTVLVGANDEIRLSFRNPTHMIQFTDPEPYQAYYETDEAIRHCFYHANMAPFISIRFAQRFGISNPSPRYVAVMSDAFRSGIYEDKITGTRFGTGKYGDLLALTASVLLDREARSVVLDADPAHGSLLEPFLRLVRVMRSLEFQPDEDRPMIDFGLDLQDIIGQQPHRLPNVFSFFLPEFKPHGRLGEAQLTCPECRVMTIPKTIAHMNGMLSLFKYGWDTAYGGFGIARQDKNENDWYKRTMLEYEKYSFGRTTYSPAERDASAAEVVDELATLLTSGRLSWKKRAILQEVYEEAMTRGERLEALVNVEQLIVSTPEFHATGLVRSTSMPRALPQAPETSSKPYKAVINIFLEGGLDSFNVLVPEVCHTMNAAGVPVNEQYNLERSVLALEEDERKFNITVDPKWEQPCSVFTINPQMPILKEIYDDGDLLFFANTGVINVAEGMDKTNFEEMTVSQLFAHNTMQHETKRIDPFDTTPGTGILGRMSESLRANGFISNSLSIDTESVAVNPFHAPKPIIVSRHGANEFDERPPDEVSFSTVDFVFRLNNESSTYSNLYGETWSSEFIEGIDQATKLKAGLATVNIERTYPPTTLGERVHMLAKLIKSRETRGVDRDLFFATQEGYDNHAALKQKLKGRLIELNDALTWLVQELKNQEMWDNVTIVITSDFARTMTSNGKAGSDHGWGGNYWIMGGSIAGGGILGEYPSDLTPEGPLNLGRGRFIPTTSWDSVWNAVAGWMGAAKEEDLDLIMPNREKAAGLGRINVQRLGRNNVPQEDHTTGIQFTRLLHEQDVFKTVENTVRG